MDRAIKDLDAVLYTLILIQETYRNGILDKIDLDKLLNGPIEALIDYIDLLKRAQDLSNDNIKNVS